MHSGAIKCKLCGKKLTEKQLKRAKWNNRISEYCSLKCAGQKIRNFDYDDKFLNEITPFSAYFLGFFVTDGHLDKKRFGVHFDGIKDKELIDQFVKKTNYGKKIGEYQREDSPNKEYSITYYGNVSKRIREMGFTNHKSGNEFIPNCINNEAFPHFLRGAIDGDGWVHKIKRGGYLLIGICGSSKKFIEDIHKRLLENNVVKGGCISEGKDKHRIKTMHRLTFGHADSVKLGNYIYQDADIKLHRKFIVYEQNKDLELKAQSWEGFNCIAHGCNNPAKIKEMCKIHYDEQYRREYMKNPENREKLAIASKKWKEEHPEKAAEYKKISYNRNREKILEYNQNYNKENKEHLNKKAKEYRSNNKDKINKRKKEYRKENPEKHREWDKVKYENNREKTLDRNRTYKEENREKLNSDAAAYREKNRELIRQRDHERYLKNREEINRKRREKRAVKKKSS